MSKELSTIDTSEKLPAHLQNAKGGLGNEDVTADDLQTPQLKLLQATSNEMKPNNARFIKGAQSGQWCNSVTQEIFDSVLVASLKLEPGVSMIKQQPGETMGQLEGFFPDSDQAAIENFLASKGAEASLYTQQKTHRHTVAILNDKGEPQSIARMYMSKSQMKVSKNWNSQIATKEAKVGKRLDRFAGIWELTSVTETAGQNSWYIPHISFKGWAKEELHAELTKLYSSINTQPDVVATEAEAAPA